MNRRKTPQEKKRLSYSKDRRNTYGENDKSSRKNIARNKRNRARSERHREQQQLSAASGPADAEVEAEVEAALDERLARARRGSRWRKFPDTRLGLHVERSLARRAETGISAEPTERARIAKVRRKTKVEGAQRRRKW